MTQPQGGGEDGVVPLKAGGDDWAIPLRGQLSLAPAAGPAQFKQLGRAMYHAQQLGSTLTICASGTAPNWNTTVHLEVLPFKIFPPQYGLFFYEQRVALPATRPFTVEARMHTDTKVQQINVLDAEGLKAVEVSQL